MYAIIQDGGHQYRVEKGQKVRVELRQTGSGDTLVFDKVCLLAGEGEPRIGKPYLDGARVEGQVTNPDFKDKKIHVRTFRRRKRTRRHLGHRQRYVEVVITDIVS